MQPKLLEIDIDELVPNDWNTNIVTPENEAKLDASIKRNGMFKPIVVREIIEGDSDDQTAAFRTVLQIIGGEHRWDSAKRLGFTKVPIVNLGKVDDAKAKEIGIIDNTRYGADDTLSYAELLKSLGDVEDLQDFLPYAAEDLASIFSTADIALDELDADENDEDDQPEVEKVSPPPKTHTIMRFKVSLRDAEHLTALIADTQKSHGLTSADELTNAGDALVTLLLGQTSAENDTKDPDEFSLDELDHLLEEAGS